MSNMSCNICYQNKIYILSLFFCIDINFYVSKYIFTVPKL